MLMALFGSHGSLVKAMDPVNPTVYMYHVNTLAIRLEYRRGIPLISPRKYWGKSYIYSSKFNCVLQQILLEYNVLQ